MRRPRFKIKEYLQYLQHNHSRTTRLERGQGKRQTSGAGNLQGARIFSGQRYNTPYHDVDLLLLVLRCTGGSTGIDDHCSDYSSTTHHNLHVSG